VSRANPDIKQLARFVLGFASLAPTWARSITWSEGIMNDARLKGLLKLLGGGVLFAIVFAYIYDNGLGDPSRGSPFKLIAMGLPGAIVLVGLVETITGLPFAQISEAWDGLTGWQRGVYGLIVIVVAIVVVFFVLVPIFGGMFI
jgi:hypothetical protein